MILVSDESRIMNLPPYIFDVDHVAKIRSGLSVTIPEKKNSTKSPLNREVFEAVISIRSRGNNWNVVWSRATGTRDSMIWLIYGARIGIRVEEFESHRYKLKKTSEKLKSKFEIYLGVNCSTRAEWRLRHSWKKWRTKPEIIDELHNILALPHPPRVNLGHIIRRAWTVETSKRTYSILMKNKTNL